MVALIADWGTGLDDANWLLSEMMQRKPDVLIHLGDIYYAGTASENRANFLNPMDSVAPNIPIYTLSGNHDMYSGGAPYYSLLSQLNATPALRPYQQKASYFCLRSANWQILAMDTGLHDGDPLNVTTNLTFLDPQEAAWHIDKLKNTGGRRTILLSHHQLFTAFGGGVGQGSNGKPLAYNPNLYSTFAPYLGRIALWLWGHEHNFEIFFHPLSARRKAAALGAAAIPCLKLGKSLRTHPKSDLQGQSGLPTLAPGILELSVNPQGVYFHNYAILTLRSPQSQFKDSKIEYYQIDSYNHGPSMLMGGGTESPEIKASRRLL